MAKYRIFQRKRGIWYLQDRKSVEQESLRTRDKTEATRLLNAKNEAVYQRHEVRRFCAIIESISQCLRNHDICEPYLHH